MSISSAQYRPLISYDVPLSVLISLGQLKCLDSIEKNSPNLKEQIKSCFLNVRMKKFYEDLQLFDVKASCLKENLNTCTEYNTKCSNPPCGHLGDFIRELNSRSLTEFNQVDGEEACKSLIK